MSRKYEDNKESGYTMTGRYAFSKKGIDKVTEFLSTKGFKEVINVEDDPLYRKKDIDLIARKNLFGRDVDLTIEVKCDSYPARNLYYETISNKTYNTPGCLVYSEAHLLYYLYDKENVLYVINMKELQKWFKLHKEILEKDGRKKTVKNHDERTGGYYYSEGFTIPLDYIKKNLDPKHWKEYRLTRNTAHYLN